MRPMIGVISVGEPGNLRELEQEHTNFINKHLHSDLTKMGAAMEGKCILEDLNTLGPNVWYFLVPPYLKGDDSMTWLMGKAVELHTDCNKATFLLINQ